jgi:hypothetical protein
MKAWVVLAIIAAVALLILFRTRGAAPPTTPRPQRVPQRRPGHYPGDFTGTVTLEYSPHPDGSPDPGEVVWTWVPFEEDHTKGKDRPVLLIGRDGGWLLGVMLTSKDHDHDQYHRERWLDIGTGAWDRQRRPSEARLDRIIRVDPRAVRREGATVPRPTFDEVSRSLSRLHHW